MVRCQLVRHGPRATGIGHSQGVETGGRRFIKRRRLHSSQLTSSRGLHPPNAQVTWLHTCTLGADSCMHIRVLHGRPGCFERAVQWDQEKQTVGARRSTTPSASEVGRSASTAGLHPGHHAIRRTTLHIRSQSSEWRLVQWYALLHGSAVVASPEPREARPIVDRVNELWRLFTTDRDYNS